MSLRAKFISYLIILHILFAPLSYFLFLKNRFWLFAIEFFFVLSFLIGSWIIRALFRPVDLVVRGAELMKEKDFTTRFKEMGHQEIDVLIDVYNSMVDKLREERLKLEEQNLFLDKLLKATLSSIIILDYDEIISMINPSAENLLLNSKFDLIGNTLADLKTPFSDELSKLKLNESKVISYQGSRRMKCRKSQFLDKGFPRKFIVIEELTEELRLSEKAAYGKLIRMMSHEVNNSVGAVNSLLNSCLNYKDQLNNDDILDFENALNVAIERSENLNSFMRGFANVIRLPDPKPVEEDIIRIAKNNYLLFKSECERKSINWVWDIAVEFPLIKLDKPQMDQVFVNIYKNAIEAIGNNGSITFRTRKYQKKLCVIIEDTGSGISREVQSCLFTPFYSTKENGQGLGLTLIQEILKRHNFEFALEGAPGGPTQFSIYFSE